MTLDPGTSESAAGPPPDSGTSGLNADPRPGPSTEGAASPSHRATTGRRVLIVNADDLGLSDGVTEGIVRAWRDGVVTSTSAMVNIDGAPERISAVHADHPDLPIGLHLNITDGRPVLPPGRVPTLVGADGRFRSIEEIPKHLLNIAPTELAAELHAQAELLTSIGVRFSHIDYHQHIVVLYTPFFRHVLALAKQYNVPLRQPVPASLTGAMRFESKVKNAALKTMLGFALRHPMLSARLIRHMTPGAVRRQDELLRAAGLRAPDLFIDGFFRNASVENFIEMLRQLPPGVSEVVVHPGIVDDGLRSSGGSYIDERAEELAVLLDPRVRAAVAAENVELASFALLGAA